MNMLDIRHKLTRTYRGAGGATKARALAMIDTALKGLDVTATADSVRTTIGHVVRKELQEDQSVVESIYSQSSVPAETRKKASKGMADVRTLNKGRWPDLFG